MGLSMVQKDVAQMGVETIPVKTTTLTCQDLVDLVQGGSLPVSQIIIQSGFASCAKSC